MIGLKSGAPYAPQYQQAQIRPTQGMGPVNFAQQQQQKPDGLSGLQMAGLLGNGGGGMQPTAGLGGDPFGGLLQPDFASTDISTAGQFGSAPMGNGMGAIDMSQFGGFSGMFGGM